RFLAAVDELALALRQGVGQQADDQVGADRRTRASRAASAVLVEELHHRVQDRGRTRSRLRVSVVGAGHASLPSWPPLRMERAARSKDTMESGGAARCRQQV